MTRFIVNLCNDENLFNKFLPYYYFICQAVNSLAVSDDNKLKLVEAGALPQYVKLLSPERDETLHTEAAHGLWMLAFKCKDSILKETGCLDGRYFVVN